jgi:hypothetical protein
MYQGLEGFRFIPGAQSFYVKICLMVLYVLYTKDSPHQRDIEAFARELERRQVKAKLIEADSPQGTSLTQLYDLPARPALVLTRDDGTMVERWQGQLPLVADVSYLAHN